MLLGGEEIMAQTLKPGETGTITTPGGNSFEAHGIANGAFLVSTSADGDGNTIVVQGDTGGTAEFPDILGAVGDGVMGILKAAKDLLGCKMTTTTTVNVGPDGKITSVVTTTTCAPT